MNYGLRYEYYSPLREDRNLFTFFDMTTGDLDPNPNRAWYGSSKTNFGPRLAFTWAPERFKGKTVLRIGAGYYYGPGQTEDQVQPIDSDRVTVTQHHQHRLPGEQPGDHQQLRREQPQELRAARLRARLHAAGEDPLLHGVASSSSCRSIRC